MQQFVRRVLCWMPWTTARRTRHHVSLYLKRGEQMQEAVVESGAIWGRQAALFGGERLLVRQDEAGRSRTSQEEVSMELAQLGDGPARAGGRSHKPRRA